MNRLIEKTFENRGYTSDYIHQINNPEHDDLMDVDLLSDKLRRIHDSGELMAILPDFDMDGIASGVLGFAGFAELGFNVSLFMPDPKEGYGFSEKTVMRLMSDYPGVRVILTCDTGIGCVEGIEYAKSCGIEVLVTDHHKQQDIVSADCIVNPMRLDETYSHPRICGAYVLYQCLYAYTKKYESNPVMLEQIRRLRVFAGIGTVSDMMPLLYENRPLVLDAVNICKLLYADGDDSIVKYITGHDVYRKAFYGIFTVLAGFAKMGKISTSDSITEEFFGYYLAPLFNSVKRMDGDIMRAFGVFFGNSPKDDFDYLYDLNEARKETVAFYINEIETTDQPYAPYIYLSSAASGILGLLAGDIIRRTGMPVLAVRRESDGTYHGSGRSVDWYPYLTRTAGLSFAAGHEVSFGVGFQNEDELKAVFAFLSKDVADVYANVDSIEVPPDFVVALDGSGDTSIDIVLFAEYLDEVSKLRPFGVEFPKPNVELRFRANDGEWSVLGSVKQHLKISLPMGFDVLLWNRASEMSRKNDTDTIIVHGYLSMNEFRGSHTVNFIGDFVA